MESSVNDSSTLVQNSADFSTIFHTRAQENRLQGLNLARIDQIKAQFDSSSTFSPVQLCATQSTDSVAVNSNNLSFYTADRKEVPSIRDQFQPYLITSSPLPTISISAMSSPESHHHLYDRIHRVVQTCGDRMRHVHPKDFLQFLLVSRGYDNSYIEALTERESIFGYMSTAKQVEDYDCSIVDAVRLSDLQTLQRLSEAGKSMSACNRFSESIFHLACRRSSYETVRFMMSKVDTVFLVDDYGRTPLHDACWRIEPHFDIVALLMDATVDLVRCKDKRGAIPLDYVREEHWPLWCAFLDIQKDKYWPDIKKLSA